MNHSAHVIIMVLWGISAANISLSDPLFRPDAECDYLIIAPAHDGMLAELERLSQLKWQKGLKTRIVTVDSIARHCKGSDTPAKIRSLLQTAYNDWGITWVLLAGDYSLIPARIVQPYDGFGSNHDTPIFSDIYYSCLEGTWDGNNDGIYGNERTDITYSLECRMDGTEYVCDKVVPVIEGLDLWYDVYIGRMPASNAEELRIMIEKTIRYTDSPNNTGYANDIFLTGAKQFDNSVYSSTIDGATDFLHNGIRPIFIQEPSVFQDCRIDELYEDRILPGGRAVNDSIEITADTFSTCLERGYNLVYWTFHGQSAGIDICSFLHKPDFGLTEAAALRSQSFSNIISLSCLVMRTMPDTAMCFAKALLTNPNGGAVSFTGSNWYDFLHYKKDHYPRMTRLLSTRSVTRISCALQLSTLENFLIGENQMITHYWGDPELELHTRPIAPSDSFSIAVTREGGMYLVSVSPEDDSVLVCMYKAGELFLRGYTENGTIHLPAADNPIDNVMVTATHHNFLPGRTVINTSELPMGVRAGIVITRKACPFDIIVRGRQIRVRLSTTARGVDLRLMDIAGKTLARACLAENGRTVFTEEYAPGLYVLTADIDGIQFVRQVLLR